MTANRTQSAIVLTLVVLVIFASLGLGRFGFSMVLPPMQEALDLSNAQTGELQSWNSLGYLLVVVGAGMLATRHGPTIVVTLALVAVGLSMIATGLFPNFPSACAGRFVSGAGGAAANVPAMALLSAWFSGKRRGLAAGCAVGGSSLGLAITGAGVPFIIAQYGTNGWRVCWYAFGAVTLVIALLCGCFLKNAPPEGHSNQAALSSDARPRKSFLLKQPMLWKIAVTYFAFGFSYSIYATFFVKHLVRDIGLQTTEAGHIWTRIGVASIISGFVWGAVSDRWSRRAALIAIFACQGTAFCLVGIGQTHGWVMASGVLFACTAWSIPAVVSALCGDAFGPRLAPTALGIVTVAFGIGQVLGPLSGGILADRTGSFAAAFGVAGVVALILGGTASALISPVRKH